MIVRDRLYVDGAWVPSTGDGVFEVVDSTTEKVMGTVPAGTAADVDAAVAAARRAFDAWSRTSLEERRKYLQAITEGLTARQPEIAELIAGEVGMPLQLATMIQAGLPTITFASMTEIIDEVAWEETIGSSLVVREPVGVVGAITPWNYPLHQICAKVAPALAAGCTIVVKPSEIAPLNAFVLAEVIDAAGLPAGVFNLVTGDGPTVGEAIAGHPDVDMVSFTGSTRAGRRVAALAAETVKRVALELGGKSPNVLLDDLEGDALAQAVGDGLTKCWLNSGQTCSALTRMIVPRGKLAEVEATATAIAQFFAVGDPRAEGTVLGPLVSAAQRDRVRGYIERGTSEGARLVAGGAAAPAGLNTGFFVQPTIFSDVTTDMVIAQEEIFGPVLVIMPYDTEEEAVEIANDTVYGLAGGVWSADPDRAQRVARRLRTGQVEINGGVFNPLAPFGGYKQSGTGRELGPKGIEEFLEVKAMQL